MFLTSGVHIICVKEGSHSCLPRHVPDGPHWSSLVLTGPRWSSLQVGTLYATDADVGANAALQFSLIDVTQGDRSLFRVAPGGVIYTAADVDREQVDTHVLRVIVTDDGWPQLTSQTDVTIHVLDRNDRYPFCGQGAYSVSVTENSPVSVKSVAGHSYV